MDPRPKKSGKKSKKDQSVRTSPLAYNISPQPPSNMYPQPPQNMSHHYNIPHFANNMAFAGQQMPYNIEQSPQAQVFGSSSFNQVPMQCPQILHRGYAPQYFQPQGSNDMSGGMNMFHPMSADSGSYYAPHHNGLLAHMRAETATPDQTPVESPASPTSQFPPFSTQEGTQDTGEDSVQDSVEVVPPGGRAYGKKRKWLYDDNCALVSAWIKYSVDAEDNICQAYDTFWGKIVKAVNARVPPPAGHQPRTVSTCKNHWNSMVKEIMSFVACFEKECRNAQSGGDSEEFIIKEAYQTYLQRHGKNFYYRNEWETLRKEAKWKSLVKSRSKQPESSESGKRTRDDNDGGNSETPGNNWEPSDPLPRPVGIKATKKKKTRASSSNSSTSTAATDLSAEYNRMFAEKMEMAKTSIKLKEMMIKTNEETNKVNADLARANKMTFLGNLMTLDSQGKLTDQQRVIMNSLLEELYGGQ